MIDLTSSTTIVELIMAVFATFRMAPTAIDQYESTGKDILRAKIIPFVQQNRPVKFAMLGFPMKSTSPEKVIGVLPDMAEQLAFENFMNFGQQVRMVYPPGVEIYMASDGLVFSDVLGVDDNTVDAYVQTSIDMSAAAPVTWVDLRSFYNFRTPLSELRSRLMTQFAPTPDMLKARILTDPDTNVLYRGMIHFMEAELEWKGFTSRNQLHKSAKELANSMMLRNEAYSRLVSTNLADCIRLSMHPSMNSGAKYSFQLINSRAWTSPWHSAILYDNQELPTTIHVKDAKAAGHHIINKHGRPWHFQAAN